MLITYNVMIEEPPMAPPTIPTFVPHIEEIRVVDHDGEIYVNARDLTIAMKEYAMTTHNNTLSVLNFIKMFVFELITARR